MTITKLETPCREWMGHRNPKGYGRRLVGETKTRKVLLHRWVWEECNGPIPDGLVIMHLCDNPPCLWSLACTRLARVMLDQTGPVLGATLDGFTVAGRPRLPEDRGRAGAFRIVAEGQWPEPVRSLPDYYSAVSELVEVGA
jgi:hypothetical protein